VEQQQVCPLFVISLLLATIKRKISSSHGGEYDVQTSETSVDNHFTRQYILEDNSEHHTIKHFQYTTTNTSTSNW
jgi:hypothetical protein